MEATANGSVFCPMICWRATQSLDKLVKSPTEVGHLLCGCGLVCACWVCACLCLMPAARATKLLAGYRELLAFGVDDDEELLR